VSVVDQVTQDAGASLAERWDAFCRAHAQRLHDWYSAEGELRSGEPEPAGYTRVVTGQCISLLSTDDPANHRLANQILRRLEGDANAFLPIRCGDLLVRFPARLDDDVADHLKAICREHVVRVIERRMGGSSIDNFSCMQSFFLAAMGQELDGYTFDHKFAMPAMGYTRQRLLEAGQNAFQSLAYRSQREGLIDEFNSPTYVPITLMSLAKAAGLIKDEVTRRAALETEQVVWRQVLGMYHPVLDVSCGPFSRGYRPDLLGQVSNLRVLLTLLGIGRDASVIDLFEDDDPMIHRQQRRSQLHNWHTPAYLGGIEYHIPPEALDELRHRRFPYRFESKIHWGPFGDIDPETGRWISVQGDLLPGGQAMAVQDQHRSWCVGYRTQTLWGMTYPIHLHYALNDPPGTFRDVRHVTGGIWTHGRPTEWLDDIWGQPSESQHLWHFGRVTVDQPDGRTWRLDAQPLVELAETPVQESAFNFLIPLHHGPEPRVALNGQAYAGDPVAVTRQDATFSVADAGFAFEIELHASEPVVFRLQRWANFLRLSAVFYDGEARPLGDALSRYRVQAHLRVTKSP